MNQLRACLAMSGALVVAALCGPLPALAQDTQPTAPPAGKALLYIFRLDAEPSSALVPVAVNAEIASYLENDTYIAVSVDPGKTFVRSGDRVLGWLEFEAAADQTYYVMVRAVHGVNLVQTDINLVSEADGRRVLAQSRYVPVAPLPPRSAPPQQTAAVAPQTYASPLAEPAPTAESESKAYFRVDAGFSQSTSVDLKDVNFAGGLICGDPACTVPGKLKDVGGAPMVSGGFGYRFGAYGRGDITVGFRSYKLNTSDASVPPTKFKGTVTSLSAMASVYLDFGKTGVSPYLGLGAGVSQNKIGTVTFDDGAGFSGSVEGGAKTGFAGAFMAGVALPMAGDLALDIGYRYASLGKLEIPAAGGYAGATGKLNAHELTLGLRFF